MFFIFAAQRFAAMQKKEKPRFWNSGILLYDGKKCTFKFCFILL